MSHDCEPTIASKVVVWQKIYGRSHLPWQQTRDPYRVWLSEIMLQQTQVVTVVDYYQRFLSRFPDVEALANAPLDEVMALWSGLGYYSRARNLHLCAKAIVSDYGGRFPGSAQLLETLPGIGRSTAGAIAAFCFSERVPIMDANVRRVLTRVFGFEEDLAFSRSEKRLWSLAEGVLPRGDVQAVMPSYTQGMMDLGATVCTPKSPGCALCPLSGDCVAFAQGKPEQYPVKTRKLARRSESWWLLLVTDPAGRVWLQRRPNSGIWAGMYCVPVFSERAQLEQYAVLFVGKASESSTAELPAFLHVLTHRDLHLHPVLLQGNFDMELSADGRWYGEEQWVDLGLPAPIRKLLASTAQGVLL